MSSSIIALLCLTGAFLCGSLPFGYWAGRLRGIDIRQHGSGNIGATNVIRVCGKGIGLPVFALDMAKGWLPVVMAGRVAAGAITNVQALTAVGVGAGLAAILGHMFTPWLGFKGGKGVATAAGVLLGIAPVAMFVALAAWIIVAFATKYVSLASIVAALAVPATMAVQMWRSAHWNAVLLAFGILLAILVTARHRANIQRLVAGTENKMGRK